MCGKENLVANYKDKMECLCLGTISLIAPWKIDVLKTSIFALEASLLRQIIVLRKSNFRGATIKQFDYELDRDFYPAIADKGAVRVNYYA